MRLELGGVCTLLKDWMTMRGGLNDVSVKTNI